MQASISIPAILLTILLAATGSMAEEGSGLAKATFAVHCYDVGAGALSGRPGVVSVARGWSGAREVDRVIYDPREVSLTQLETWLKQADTYVGTLEAPMDGSAEGRKP
jgi:hypothetical protein